MRSTRFLGERDAVGEVLTEVVDAAVLGHDGAWYGGGGNGSSEKLVEIPTTELTWRQLGHLPRDSGSAQEAH
jgi:hypothetical protein